MGGPSRFTGDCTSSPEERLEEENSRLRARIKDLALAERADRWRRLIEEAIATGDLPPHIQDGMERALAGERGAK